MNLYKKCTGKSNYFFLRLMRNATLASDNRLYPGENILGRI